MIKVMVLNQPPHEQAIGESLKKSFLHEIINNNHKFVNG